MVVRRWRAFLTVNATKLKASAAAALRWVKVPRHQRQKKQNTTHCPSPGARGVRWTLLRIHDSGSEYESFVFMHHRLSKQRARGGGGKRDECGSVITALLHSSFSYPVVFPARAESRKGANVLGLQERGGVRLMFGVTVSGRRSQRSPAACEVISWCEGSPGTWRSGSGGGSPSC